MDNVLLMGGKQIMVRRAPEPNDVIWENCGISSSQKIKIRIITISITFLVLCASFGIIYGISIYAEK